MSWCPKCRYRSGGCSECNPTRFTIEERCRRERHHSEDCSACFKDYLLDLGFTAGTTADYVWAANMFFWSKGKRGNASDKRKALAGSVKPSLEKFAKQHRLATARQQKIFCLTRAQALRRFCKNITTFMFFISTWQLAALSVPWHGRPVGCIGFNWVVACGRS